ncbi:hypothetical protein niasHT_039681 [Heterodera trifolii]|uniref:Uncharacterized protein n=1 Tax=Heterodera trifolii TaxID=157864 RepID=A0ABD2IHD2_9BILA
MSSSDAQGHAAEALRGKIRDISAVNLTIQHKREERFAAVYAPGGGFQVVGPCSLSASSSPFYCPSSSPSSAACSATGAGSIGAATRICTKMWENGARTAFITFAAVLAFQPAQWCSYYGH